MATYYLRPSADVSLQHSCSTGSSGYALINEATPDDDSKYIYNEDTGSSSSGSTFTKTSSFTATGTIPSTYTISSAKVVIRAKRGGESSSDSAISGAVGSSSLSSTKLATSYINYEATVDASNLTRSGDNVTCTVSATTALKVYKNETGNVRITQIYIQVEASDNSKFYVKVDGNWVQAKKAYIKQNGSWVEATSTPSGWAADCKIKQS